MIIEPTILDEVRKINIFKNLTDADLLSGYQTSLKVKEFDSPDEWLESLALLQLSFFYEYQAEKKSQQLKQEGEDDYDWGELGGEE